MSKQWLVPSALVAAILMVVAGHGLAATSSNVATSATLSASSVNASVTPTVRITPLATASYQAFQTSELKGDDGKPLNSNTMITLSDGTRRSAGDAINMLNGHERETTNGGSSLRGALAAAGGSLVVGRTKDANGNVNAGTAKVGKATPVTKTPATKKVGRQKVIHDQALFDSQALSFNQRYPAGGVAPVSAGSTSGGSTSSTPTLTAATRTAAPAPATNATVAANQPAILKTCDPATKKLSDRWSESWGDSKSFYASMSADYKLRGSKDAVRLEGNGKVIAKLFGKSFTLLDGSGVYRATSETTGNSNIRLTVLGQDIFNEDLPAGTRFKGTKKRSVDVKVKIPLATVLGVGLKARVGARGEVGLTYDVKVSPLFLDGSVKPYVKASAYAEAVLGVSMDLGIVKATVEGGVGGRMTFLEDTFTIAAKMWLDTSTQCTPGVSTTAPKFKYEYSGTTALTALSGSLYAFFEAEGCAFGLCVGDRWEFDVFDWKGFGPITSTVFRGP